MKIGMKVIAASLTLFSFGTAQAATITPSDFDKILTEGKRETTVDGADVSGNAAVSGNGDVGVFDLGPLPSSTLLVGRLGGTGEDEFFSDNVTGYVSISILNYAVATRDPVAPFEAEFELLVNNVVESSTVLAGATVGATFENIFLGDFMATDDLISLRFTSRSGSSHFDIAVNFDDAISIVPLPATALLLLSGLVGVAGVSRRKDRPA
jgi:hypothetical protein